MLFYTECRKLLKTILLGMKNILLLILTLFLLIGCKKDPKAALEKQLLKDGGVWKIASYEYKYAEVSGWVAPMPSPVGVEEFDVGILKFNEDGTGVFDFTYDGEEELWDFEYELISADKIAFHFNDDKPNKYDVSWDIKEKDHLMLYNFHSYSYVKYNSQNETAYPYRAQEVRTFNCVKE